MNEILHVQIQIKMQREVEQLKKDQPDTFYTQSFESFIEDFEPTFKEAVGKFYKKNRQFNKANQ